MKGGGLDELQGVKLARSLLLVTSVVKPCFAKKVTALLSA